MMQTEIQSNLEIDILERESLNLGYKEQKLSKDNSSYIKIYQMKDFHPYL